MEPLLRKLSPLLVHRCPQLRQRTRPFRPPPRHSCDFLLFGDRTLGRGSGKLRHNLRFGTYRANGSKYFHLLAGLPPEIAAELDDVLATVSLTEAYDVLKSAILDRLEVSERARFQQLLSEEDLGDRKPSQLLHRMKQLIRDSASQSQQPLLRELFLQRLPQAMRMVLAGSEDLSLDKLAALADRIADYSAPGHPPVLAAATPAQPSRLDRIEEKLQELTDAFHSLSASRSRRHRRSTSRPPPARGQSSTPPPLPSEDTRSRAILFWYHHRFRHRAQRCISPCAWQGNARADH
ncbi:uncharacterized protein LOC135374228 [Ornithodoros turicata]|uniref:uncharacterized protein LOC135374228 n=1 Tax=Ornithodoros turicata TaxID=34597 RepID=UPI00313999E1